MPNYEDIKINDFFQFERLILADDVKRFADLTGDYNPLHVDSAFGAKSQFGKNIVHGMLAASLFSTLIGMHCPGEEALYLSQTLNFRKPIFPGDNVIVRGAIIAKNDVFKVITLLTEILRGEEIMVSGEAKARFLE